MEAHLDNRLAAGLGISGINAEVTPGQWEFQVGPPDPVTVADQLWIARWLHTAPPRTREVPWRPLATRKPVKGD